MVVEEKGNKRNVVVVVVEEGNKRNVVVVKESIKNEEKEMQM